MSGTRQRMRRLGASCALALGACSARHLPPGTPPPEYEPPQVSPWRPDAGLEKAAVTPSAEPPSSDAAGASPAVLSADAGVR